MRNQLMQEFVAAAREASHAVMKYYGGDIAVELKADSSPATLADSEAEAVILERLRAFDAELPIVAEESVSRGEVPAGADRFVLVDPLDGTKEFIKGRTDFTVNLALIESGIPVMGVIAAPARGEMFGGELGRGAWQSALDLESDEEPSRAAIRVREPKRDALVVVASVSHSNDETRHFIERFRVGGLVGAGSSIKFCEVARGAADLYPRLGRTMEWDTAAGDAILRAAGGRVDTLDGRPLGYGKRNQTSDSDFANPHFVAASFDWQRHQRSV